MEHLLSQSTMDASKLNHSITSASVKALNPNRRNTTSTMHVHDTMSRPDNEAIIDSVAETLYGYLEKLPPTSSTAPPPPPPPPSAAATRMTDDLTLLKKLRLNGIDEDIEMENAPPSAPQCPPPPPPPVVEPTIKDIAAHITNIFITAQCSVDCTVVCLIYLERFFKLSGLKFTVRNWKTLTATAMLLASKVWDDLSMVNSDFAMFLPYTVDQINTWERQFLTGMRYDVRVSASHYAKYYFDLRARATQNRGFVFEDDDAPLDVEKAQRLEALSSAVQKRVDSFRRKGSRPEVRRAVSDQYMATPAMGGGSGGVGGGTNGDSVMSVAGGDVVMETPKAGQKHHGVSILD